ncbi:hypothetical protein [Pseudoalteromonas marina]|uniref:DUF3085 domain-containing protein n=1 Tax=Pseudoalteromonas marina TaxID=267375 RepID=A0ABT9FI32_9GAMM|nr:hypothetical protein [Pseudoalteromonas marina]MDP2566458.1 hypothetical protein [Pseudoalteromonas marina]
MNNTLEITKAKELITFISKTNYELAPYGDGLFLNQNEALAHVDSNEYDPAIPLNVCFDTKQGENWESASVSFEGNPRHIIDSSMGGNSSKAKSIKDALISFRIAHDETCDHYPIELSLTQAS